MVRRANGRCWIALDQLSAAAIALTGYGVSCVDSLELRRNRRIFRDGG
jgi:hypothetical protein